MEEMKQETQIIISQFYCLNNKKGVHLCLNINCPYSAITCGDPDCKCMLERHQDCQITPFQRLIKRIISKKKVLSKQLNKAFDAIDKIYVQMIDKLSIDREELALIKDNFGLSSDEANFLQLIKSKQSQLIKGSLINKLKSKINQQRDFTQVNEANIKQSWELQKETFQNSINKLKRLYTDKQFFKPIKFNWSKEIQMDGFKIIQNKIFKTGNGLGLGHAFLQPSLSFEKKSVCGLKLNKVTQNNYILNIGILNRDLIKVRPNLPMGMAMLTPIQQQICFYMSSNGIFQGGLGYQPKSCFTFGSGDTIYIMYDPLTSELKFCKNVSEGFFKAKIEDKIKSQAVSIFINGFQIGNQIELITQIPSINWNQQINISTKPTFGFGGLRPQSYGLNLQNLSHNFSVNPSLNPSVNLPGTQSLSSSFPNQNLNFLAFNQVNNAQKNNLDLDEQHHDNEQAEDGQNIEQ